jgi:hypothetical protein
MEAPPINKQVATLAKANRQQDMPSAWRDAYGAVWFVIDETNNIVGRLNKPVFDLDSEEAEVVFLMLFNSLSDIISAVYTLSSGWIRPCKIALRGALEIIATAVTVHHDPKKMARFINNRLGIPSEVIGPAKQFFPDIGHLNGALTNQWTHETYDSTARSIHEASKKLLLVPNVNSDSTKAYLNAFVEAAVLARYVGIGLEACFPNLAGDEIHFATDSSGNRLRKPAQSDSAIEMAVQARNSFRP